MIPYRQVLVVRLEGILWTSKQDANVVSVIEASIEVLVIVRQGMRGEHRTETEADMDIPCNLQSA